MKEKIYEIEFLSLDNVQKCEVIKRILCGEMELVVQDMNSKKLEKENYNHIPRID